MDWPLFFGVLAGSVAGGPLILWTVALFYHFKYYRLRGDRPEEWKCQPKRFLRPDQLREVMISSTANLALAGILTGIGVYAILMGWDGHAIYFEVDDYGWGWTLGGTVVFFVLTDAIAYYTHRFLHLRFMFRHVHRWHHRYVATTPWVVTALHPLEMLILQTATLTPLLFIPFHYASVIIVLVYTLAFNVIDHSGVDLQSRLPWQGPSRYHDDHHVYFHVNFGQHLMIWDRLHGTLRRQNRTYDREVFGGKGRAEGHEGEAAPPFIEY